ncbi:hypothetical protein [Conchiformibius steedae]|uniref:hypothetical protein n=1 Tax=Conchiformibius steedae TaxID=153493 RepID=UPI0026ED9EF5|nr:hypothetical protein [Conchiformibius steedae]
MDLANIPASYLFLYVFFIALGVCLNADLRFEMDWSLKKIFAIAAAVGIMLMLLRLLRLI